MARRDFSIKHNRASDSLDTARLKAKPLSKFKEVKHIYNRNDIKRPPLKVITARINEHYRKQNTKEYLSSWLYERRQIEKMLDEGYQIVVGDDQDSTEA